MNRKEVVIVIAATVLFLVCLTVPLIDTRGLMIRDNFYYQPIFKAIELGIRSWAANVRDFYWMAVG